MPNVDKNGEVWPDSDGESLNTSADLPMCPITEGMEPDSLSPATRSALTSGFQTDTPNEDMGPRGENADPTLTDPRGYPVSGFVRPEAWRRDTSINGDLE